MTRRPTFLIGCLVFGFAFLYVPILSMIVFSFNKSRLATVWGGFSFQWYARLFQNDQVIDAALLSLRIALRQRHLRHHPRHHGRAGPRPLPPLPRPHRLLRLRHRAPRHARGHHRHLDADALHPDGPD